MIFFFFDQVQQRSEFRGKLEICKLEIWSSPFFDQEKHIFLTMDRHPNNQTYKYTHFDYAMKEHQVRFKKKLQRIFIVILFYVVNM